MIFISDSDGNITSYFPSQVNQGSNAANMIVFAAPFAQTNSITYTVTLPNGYETPARIMTAVSNTNINDSNGNAMSVWHDSLTQIITSYSGVAKVQFSVYDTAGSIITTSVGSFPINKGVATDLPSTTTQTNIYQQIAGVLSTLQGSYEDLSETASNIQQSAENNAEQITQLNSSATDLSNTVEQNSSDIETLQTDVNGIRLEKTSELVYTLYVGDSAVGTINVPENQFLDNVTYDQASNSLIFTFITESGNQTITINLLSLIDTYTAGSGLDLSNNTFSVKIDSNQSNLLQVTDTGLYVPSGISVYTVTFTGSSPQGTRQDDAVNLTAEVGTDTQTAQNDFDTIYPWSARRRCCGNWNSSGEFVVNAYEGEPGYTTDGSNGEVWVEHSLFYYKMNMESGQTTISISGYPLAGFSPAPIFNSQNGQGTPYEKAYTAAYPMATVNGNPTSRSGVFPDTYSLNTAISTAQTLGSNYTVTTTAEWFTECLYMWVEFATLNMQSMMMGAVNLPFSKSLTATVATNNSNNIIISTTQANNFIVGQNINIGTTDGDYSIAHNRTITSIQTYDTSNSTIEFNGDPVSIEIGSVISSSAWINGTCDNVITTSGSPTSNTSGYYNCIYRGKEMPYGSCNNLLSDILFQRTGEGTDSSPYVYTPYFLIDPREYSSGQITSNYIELNYNLANIAGYISSLGKDSRYPWVCMPASVQGTATTYYCDRFFLPTFSVTGAGIGGMIYIGTGSGITCIYSVAPTYKGRLNTARLSYYRG